MNVIKKLIVAGTILVYSTLSFASSNTFDSLKKTHPRLIATDSDWQKINERIKEDKEFATFAENLVETARGLLHAPPSKYEKSGIRLLPISRETLRRTLILSSAYRITGDERFSQRAEQELLAVVAFPDWNPSHFLDVAEMTTAVSIGYDWLYGQLAPETRQAIRESIVSKALSQGLDPTVKHNNWYIRPTNWPVVCWSGLTLGALTVAEYEPELASKTLEMAREHVDIGIKPYLPDGLYPEGPSYWSFGATYHVLMNSALQTALGTQWDLEGRDAFLSSGAALTQQTGPTGLSFNFSDGVEKDAFQVPLFWFSKYTNSPEILRPHRAAIDHLVNNPNVFEETRFTALALLWWNSDSKKTASTLSTAWLSEGEQPVAVLRGSWDDPNTSYIACKGGSAAISHAHLDAGSFVFESDGIRWARDLGPQDYNSLESKGINLWNRSQESDRWTVFRLNNHSHNTLVIDGQLQSATGHAAISEFEDGERPFSIFDLSAIYEGQAESVQRGIRMEQDLRTLVQDELTGVKPGANVRWAMVTEASVDVDGDRATLSQDGKTLELQLLSPNRSCFEVIPADPPQDGINVANPNRRIVIVNTTVPEDGKTRIGVLMAPGSVSASGDSYELTPLPQWANKETPYPQSDVITGIEFDWSTHQRSAPGSDNFRLTWADDDNLYGAWGDGGGFGGNNKDGRVGLGVARIKGSGDSYRGYNVWGGFETENEATFDGKNWSMIAIDNMLYMHVSPDAVPGKGYRNHYEYIELAQSDDYGASWEKLDWRFLQSEDLTIPTFLNFGKANTGVPEEFGNYVYTYFIRPESQDMEHQGPNGIGLIVHKPGVLYLSRTPTGAFPPKKDDFEFFTGLDKSGQPTWGTLQDKAPVFENEYGVGWCLSASYHPETKRVLLSTEHNKSHTGQIGIFDAPTPWGPWTTVAYFSKSEPFGAVRTGSDLPWENNVFFISFATKWFDGNAFTMNFTGSGGGKDNDSFNTIRGRFKLIE